jgi:transposase
LAKIPEPGVCLRAERFYQQLDLLCSLRGEARRDFVAESHKYPGVNLLRQIPFIGPIRSALLVALLQTPHRFRTKRQLWAYSGELREEEFKCVIAVYNEPVQTVLGTELESGAQRSA